MRINVDGSTGNGLTMSLTNEPILVPVYWANTPSVAFGDYWTDVLGTVNTMNGVLTSTAYKNVGLTAGSKGSNTNARTFYTDGSSSQSEAHDAHARWTFHRNAYSPSNGFYTDHGVAAQYNITDAVGFVAQAEAISALANTFDTATVGLIRPNNFSTYPQDDTWTLEQYLPQLYNLSNVAWVARTVWYDQSETDCHAGSVLVPTTSNRTEYEGSFGSYVSFDFSDLYFPEFSLRTQATVNRYPSGNTLLVADLNIGLTGAVDMKPPTSWTAEENYFLSWTSAQLAGGPLDIATSDEATRFSWTFNDSEHTTSGGGNSCQWSTVDSLVLHYGPNTVLEFYGTSIGGRRFQTPRSGITMGSTLDSGCVYARSHTKSFKFTRDSVYSTKFEWDEDGLSKSHYVGTAEINATPETHIDLLVGRYYHGGNGSEFKVSTPRW